MTDFQEIVSVFRMPVAARFFVVALAAAAVPLPAGVVALLVGEPFGRFGSFNPTGHASIYLSDICAESPISLRRCQPGETGVVISRYHRIAGLDWVAVPLSPYLYAVDRPEDAPDTVDSATVARLRDEYRRADLRELAPDAEDGGTPKGDWIQLVGAAYDRRIHGFALRTTDEQDDALIAYLNGMQNRKRFHLLARNCADFAGAILNFYYPGLVRRSFIADAGISTPKHAAKAVVKHAKRRPEDHVSWFVVPQTPGIRPSTRLHGVSEALIRSRKYVIPLVLVQPWVAATALAAWLTSGRFDPASVQQTVCEPATVHVCISAGNSVAGSASPPDADAF